MCLPQVFFYVIALVHEIFHVKKYASWLARYVPETIVAFYAFLVKVVKDWP